MTGVATGIFPRNGANIELAQEAAIGNLVADALRLQTGTQLYIEPGGSLRSTLPSAFNPSNLALRRTAGGYAAGPPYDLVVGDVYSELPFSNFTVTMTVTGAQLWSILEHSVASEPGISGGSCRFPDFPSCIA